MAAGIPPGCSTALNLAARKLATIKESNKPFIRMPTMAGLRMPLEPCLEMPNRAMIPDTKPTTTRQSAPDATIAIILRGTMWVDIKTMRMRIVTRGQTQLTLAAVLEKDFALERSPLTALPVPPSPEDSALMPAMSLNRLTPSTVGLRAGLAYQQMLSNVKRQGQQQGRMTPGVARHNYISQKGYQLFS